MANHNIPLAPVAVVSTAAASVNAQAEQPQEVTRVAQLDRQGFRSLTTRERILIVLFLACVGAAVGAGLSTGIPLIMRTSIVAKDVLLVTGIAAAVGALFGLAINKKRPDTATPEEETQQLLQQTGPIRAWNPNPTLVSEATVYTEQTPLQMASNREMMLPVSTEQLTAGIRRCNPLTSLNDTETSATNNPSTLQMASKQSSQLQFNDADACATVCTLIGIRHIGRASQSPRNPLSLQYENRGRRVHIPNFGQSTDWDVLALINAYNALENTQPQASERRRSISPSSASVVEIDEHGNEIAGTHEFDISSADSFLPRRPNLHLNVDRENLGQPAPTSEDARNRHFDFSSAIIAAASVSPVRVIATPRTQPSSFSARLEVELFRECARLRRYNAMVQGKIDREEQHNNHPTSTASISATDQAPASPSLADRFGANGSASP